MSRKGVKDLAMMERAVSLHQNGLSTRQIARVLSNKKRQILQTQIQRWLSYNKKLEHSYPQSVVKPLASEHTL